MKPTKLTELVRQGPVQAYKKGDIVHSLDFKEELYIVETGYVKRHSVNTESSRIIESIYGPGYFFPLSPVFKKLLGFNLSQETVTYIYQAMTDITVKTISSESLIGAIEERPELYADLFYEAGIRLKANINRLSSNALKSDEKKVAHQLVYLAEEFGEAEQRGAKICLKILVPLAPIDIAEQLNLTTEAVVAVLETLTQQDVLTIEDDHIFITDIETAKDVYL